MRFEAIPSPLPGELRLGLRRVLAAGGALVPNGRRDRNARFASVARNSCASPRRGARARAAEVARAEIASTCRIFSPNWGRRGLTPQSACDPLDPHPLEPDLVGERRDLQRLGPV